MLTSFPTFETCHLLPVSDSKKSVAAWFKKKQPTKQLHINYFTLYKYMHGVSYGRSIYFRTAHINSSLEQSASQIYLCKNK